MDRTGLMIVDMQNYYLLPESPFSRYFDSLYPGSLDYIRERANETVIPNIARLKREFAKRNLPGNIRYYSLICPFPYIIKRKGK